jgi:molybdopterin-synthase adenylyltransferase
MNLNTEQSRRYDRQIRLPEIGVEGQESLLKARVLVIGAGGLGSSAAFYLVAAGVGTVEIADPDLVTLSNLQRQILHHTPDLGRLKVESAAEKLRALNPDVSILPRPERFIAANAETMIARCDFVLECTDNPAAKFLVADACHFAGKPYSHAGINGFTGLSMTVLPGRTACLRCVFETPPPHDAQTRPLPVLGAAAGLLGALQAAEAVKTLLHIGQPLTDAMLCVDLLHGTFRRTAIHRNPACPLCGNHPTLTVLKDEP